MFFDQKILNDQNNNKEVSYLNQPITRLGCYHVGMKSRYQLFGGGG